MLDSIDSLKTRLSDPTLLRTQAYLAGEWSDAEGGATYPVTNPANGATIAEVANLGRAEVVDYGVLRTKLANGEIKGAVLDVFDPEPLPSSSPLWSTPNLIITPHVASDDADAYMPLTLDLVLENAGRHLEGRPLRNRVILSREY